MFLKQSNANKKIMRVYTFVVGLWFTHTLSVSEHRYAQLCTLKHTKNYQ